MKAPLIALLLSLPLAAQSARSPVRIILVGDSTMALKSGYGPGFCAIVRPEVTCLNMAKGGRSTSSYRAEGSWDQVMEKLKDGSAFSATWVLIQFGHNDQPGKPGRSTDLATEFPVNLRHYVDEVKAAGARPVLVTPLTRRSFRDGQLQDTLGPWAEAARRVAAETSVPVLGLHAESMAAIQKMGGPEADSLAMAPPPPTPKPDVVDPNAPVFDYTHLGPKGAAFFGSMVAQELTAAVSELKDYFRASAEK